jgi:hypothetical protein
MTSSMTLVLWQMPFLFREKGLILIEQAKTHHADTKEDRWTANAAGTNGLMCLLKHEGAQNKK